MTVKNSIRSYCEGVGTYDKRRPSQGVEKVPRGWSRSGEGLSVYEQYKVVWVYTHWQVGHRTVLI